MNDREKKCERCGKSYYKKQYTSLKNWSKSKYCSKACLCSKNPKKKCSYCGKIFHNSHKKVKYCSKRCYYKSKIGKSSWNTGLTYAIDNRVPRPWLGKKRSKETIEKMSKGRRGKKTGKENNMWNGGITNFRKSLRNIPEYKMWRMKVFERDDYACQKCGERGGELQADHISPFAYILDKYNIKNYNQAISCKELWDIKNGRALCKKCHLKTSTWGSGKI